MRKITFLFAILAAMLYAVPAYAQASRTWVSGVGDDVNPCSRTAPCKTFAGAISKTVTGGEINCLDPGGFGALTITKSLVIDCQGTFGSVLAAGSNAITVNVPSGFVTLRSLTLNGLLNDPSGAHGLIGISITAAQTVFIEDCVVEGFSTHGISDTRSIGGNLFVRNTVVRNNISSGSNAAGFNLAAASPTNVVLENVHVLANNFGVLVANNNSVVVSRSVVAGNNIAGVQSNSGGQAFVDFTELVANGQAFNNAGTLLAIANSDAFFNAIGIAGAAVVGSFGNNRTDHNTSPGSAPNHGTPSQEYSQQ
jgi:Periplasmic copper-binding protein (NosD)